MSRVENSAPPIGGEKHQKHVAVRVQGFMVMSREGGKRKRVPDAIFERDHGSEGFSKDIAIR